MYFQSVCPMRKIMFLPADHLTCITAYSFIEVYDHSVFSGRIFHPNNISNLSILFILFYLYKKWFYLKNKWHIHLWHIHLKTYICAIHKVFNRYFKYVPVNQAKHRDCFHQMILLVKQVWQKVVKGTYHPVRTIYRKSYHKYRHASNPAR